MKKLITLLLAMLMCVSTFSFMFGCSTSGLVYELNSDESSYMVTGFSEDFDPDKAPEEIVIAAKKGGKPVTKIGARAFQKLTNVKKVVIPEGVTDISSSAFYGCTNLEEIEIPSTVKNIGSMAFYNCKKLKAINLPEGIEDINGSVFYGCESLIQVALPSSATVIKAGAFNGSGVKKLVVPNKVTKLEDGAFKNATKLEEIVIGGGIQTLGTGLFDGCESLKKVTLSDGLIAIYEYAFAGCKSLESIVIPQSVRAIYNYAFLGCENLRSMTFEKADCYECNNPNCGATIAPDSIAKGFQTHYHSTYWKSTENNNNAYVHYHNVLSHDISDPNEAWKMFVKNDANEEAIGGTLHNYPHGGLSSWTLSPEYGYLYNGDGGDITFEGKKYTPEQIISMWSWDDSVGFLWYNGTKGDWE